MTGVLLKTASRGEVHSQELKYPCGEPVVRFTDLLLFQFYLSVGGRRGVPVVGYLHVEEVSEVPGRFVRHDHLAPPVLHTPVRVPEAGLGGLGGVAALKDGVCRVSEAVTGEKNPSWWQGGCGSSKHNSQQNQLSHPQS